VGIGVTYLSLFSNITAKTFSSPFYGSIFFDQILIQPNPTKNGSASRKKGTYPEPVYRVQNTYMMFIIARAIRSAQDFVRPKMLNS